MRFIETGVLLNVAGESARRTFAEHSRTLNAAACHSYGVGSHCRVVLRGSSTGGVTLAMRVVKVLRNIFWGDDERLTFPTIFHLKVDPSAARKVDSWDAGGAKEVAQQYFCPSKFCGTPDPPTKALRCTATAWIFIVAESFAKN